MAFQIFSSNEWLYPDMPKAKETFFGEIKLHAAKNGHVGFQILFDEVQKNANFYMTNKPDFISEEILTLVDILCEKNTGPICFCVKDGEDCAPYTTRKAPFRVYDAAAPFSQKKDSRAYYISFKVGKNAEAGEYKFEIKIGDNVISVCFKVYEASVPEKETLFISNWFGTNQMAAQHKVETWSEEHWDIIEKYAKMMRRTCQTHFLIPKEAFIASRDLSGKYHFDYTQVKRMIQLFLSLGFTHIEGPLIVHRPDFWADHFIIDAVDKTYRALSDEGYDYICQYLKAWADFLKENNWLDKLHQHVGDEPIPECAHEYRIIAGIVRRFLPGVPLMEAVEMSDLDGAVDIWIPKNSWYNEHQEEFERKRKNGDTLWFYTCCYPGGHYLNRLWDMPLIRTRLLHTGNYRYNMTGFLHWGLNFCDLDRDPFNQEEIFFPPGDTHITYPGDGEPWGSMRLEMMTCGVEDYELLKQLEKINKPLADKIAKKWLPAFNNANENVEEFEEGRIELLEALEQAKSFVAKNVSPLCKIFQDECCQNEQYSSVTALKGERVSYQISYSGKGFLKGIDVHIKSDIAEYVKLFYVDAVPCALTNYDDPDDYLLRSTPGLYPDILRPLERVSLLPSQTHSVWVYVDTEKIEAGIYEIEAKFILPDGDRKLGKTIFTLEVLAAELPEQELVHTEWFYIDCLSTYYGVEIFSDEHKKIVENYVAHYATHGMNMILTPIFSPALEMNVGGDRPTVQLVDVTQTENSYKFDFTKLAWFVGLCKKYGIKYFEFSHLFSQWGAAYSPKIFAIVDGEYKQIFGWDVKGDSPEYVNFVEQFLKALDGFIKENNLQDGAYLHISDEPGMWCLDTYKTASETIKKANLPYPVLDAMSDYEFFKLGLVDRPVSSTNHIEEFMANNVPNLWAYYCCCEYKNALSNRFINMPSERTRIIGFQLYKFEMEGFLHWGYNHWYSGRSTNQNLDPYKVTDADFCFPSGDAFLVYPGKDGQPINSIRMMLVEQAMQDIRACKKLEELAGREKVIEILDNGVELSFTSYAHCPEILLDKRKKINEEIRKLS